MNFLIRLKYGFCPKTICSLCNRCKLVESSNTAIITSLDVPCLKYGFAEVISVNLLPVSVENMVDFITEIIDLSNQDNIKN